MHNPRARMNLALVVISHLGLLVLLYGQSHTFDYVFFDDTEYVLDTPQVMAGLSWDGVLWAFTSLHMYNWHPLTWISYMFDISMFGVDPGWAHIHNMLLHGLNGLLVFAILLKFSGSVWKSYVLSIIFLVHPLHVESVAWIAERKDVLCAVFFLSGMLLYDGYRAKSGTLRYLGVLAAYSLALMAKPMAVTFPLVLLVLDFFVYRKNFQIEGETAGYYDLDYTRAVVEKLPMLALSLGAGVLTIVAQDTAVVQLEQYSPLMRLTTAATAYLIYLRQFLLPVDLIAHYPMPDSIPLKNLIFPGTALLALVAVSLGLSRKLPLFAAGIFIYFVTLLPVIGLIQVGSQAHADRYMYIPSLGLLIACVYLIPDIEKRHFKIGRAVSVIFIIYLSTICYWQVSYWKDRHTLFSRVLDVSSEHYLAHIHLASDYWIRKMLDESREHLLEAISLRPDLPDAYFSMANIALAEEEFEAAEGLYRMAISRGTNSAEVHNNLGIALAEQGFIAEAVEAFELAMQMEPGQPKPRRNLELYTDRAKMEGTL